MAIDVQQLLNTEGIDFEQAAVAISLPENAGSFRRLRAIVQSDFSIGGGNSFNTPFESSAQDGLSQTVNVVKTAAGNVSALAGFEDISNKLQSYGQIQLKQVQQTINFWAGSQRPQFNLSLLFISIRVGDDVRDQVQTLYKTVFPSVRRLKGVPLLSAPLGYNGQSGTFAIKLGTWFQARNLVMKDVNFTFSRKQTPLDVETIQGTANNFAPLFATGTISFEPFRDITYDEFLDYFTGLN